MCVVRFRQPASYKWRFLSLDSKNLFPYHHLSQYSKRRKMMSSISPYNANFSNPIPVSSLEEFDKKKSEELKNSFVDSVDLCDSTTVLTCLVATSILTYLHKGFIFPMGFITLSTIREAVDGKIDLRRELNKKHWLYKNLNPEKTETECALAAIREVSMTLNLNGTKHMKF